MGFLKEHCQFSPVTYDLLSRLGDFTCEEESDISDFFKIKAIPASEEMMSKSYCLFNPEQKEMVAAFCVLNATLSMEQLPNYSKRHINKSVQYEKQRRQYPATLIGQFVVFDKFRSLHLGDEFMQFVLSWLLTYSQSMGNRFALIDAINKTKVLDFYVNNNFRFLFRTDEEELKAIGKEPTSKLATRMMYLDLKSLSI